MSEANHLRRVQYKFLNPIAYYNYITLGCLLAALGNMYLVEKAHNGWLLVISLALGITTIVRVMTLFSRERKAFKEPFMKDLDNFSSKGYFQQIFLKNIYKDSFNNDEEVNKYNFYQPYIDMVVNKSTYFLAPQNYLSETSYYVGEKIKEKSKFDYQKCEKDFPDFLNKINKKLFYKVGLLGLAIADNNVELLKFLKKQDYYKTFDMKYNEKFIQKFMQVLEEGQIEYKMTDVMAKELTDNDFYTSLPTLIQHFILKETKKLGFDETILKDKMTELKNSSSISPVEVKNDENVVNEENLSSFSIFLAKQFNELYQDSELNNKLNTIVMYQNHLKVFLAEFDKNNSGNVNFIEDSLFINNNVAQFLKQIKNENDLALQIKKVNVDYFNVSKAVTHENLIKKLDTLIEKLEKIQSKLTQSLSESLLNMQEVGNKVLLAKA